jgi:hypothetical protein
MAHRHLGRQRLSLGQQALSMKKYFPDFTCSIVCNRIIWSGHIQPTNLSDMYKLRIEYSLSSWPKVMVIQPKLIVRPSEEEIPHMYCQQHLCLYRPGRFEWGPDMFISQSIIPWASLWLYYYEIWFATGKWLGGGEHPSPKRIKSQGV